MQVPEIAGPHTVYSYRTAKQFLTVGVLYLGAAALLGSAIYLITGHPASETVVDGRVVSSGQASPPFIIGFCVLGILFALFASYMLLLALRSRVLVGDGQVMCFDWLGRMTLRSPLAVITTDLHTDTGGAMNRQCNMKAPSGSFSFSGNISNYNELVLVLRNAGHAGHTDILEPKEIWETRE